MVRGAEQIYNYRKYIRELYDNNAILKGDLIDSIYSTVENMAHEVIIQFESYKIKIAFKPEHSIDFTTFNDYIRKIGDIVYNFILENINYIIISDPEEKNDFIDFIYNNKTLLFDAYYVGDVLQFNL